MPIFVPVFQPRMNLIRYTFLFIIIVIARQIAFGQYVVFPLIKDLKGSARSVKEQYYKVELKADKVVRGKEFKKSNYLLDTKGKLLEKDDYDSSDILIERYVANYDDNENALEETQYTPDSVLNKFKFRYDNKGNQVAWMSFTGLDTDIARGSYHFDDKGRIISDSLFDAKGRLSKCASFTFDGDGHLEKEVHIAVHGNKTIDNYVFDMDGKRIQDTHTGLDGTTQYILRIKYNHDDRQNQVDILTDSGSDYEIYEKYKYDEAGNVSEEIKYAGGKMQWRHTTTYDSAKRVINTAFYDKDDKPVSKQTFVFDTRGNKLEEATYKADTLFKKIRYKYDTKGNKTEVAMNNGNEEHKSVIEYDKMGNPIKEIVYINETPVIITEREIIYY